MLAIEADKHPYGTALANNSKVVNLSNAAFVLWCWHLFWYNIYTLPPLGSTDAWNNSFTIARVLAVNLFFFVTALGVSLKFQLPLVRWFRAKWLLLAP